MNSKGLYTALYRVPDLAAGKSWYAKAFGVDPYFDEPFYVGFDIGGCELGLLPDEGQATSGDAGVVAYWGVENADHALAHLLSVDAVPHSPVEDVGGGIRVGSVKDPFGNIVGIIENPGFAR
jgi:predicted enzyme related to lactoylglutathione lyase